MIKALASLPSDPASMTCPFSNFVVNLLRWRPLRSFSASASASRSPALSKPSAGWIEITPRQGGDRINKMLAAVGFNFYLIYLI